MKRAARSAQRRGFTLVEAIASIVVVSILGSVVSGLILQAADAHAGSSVQADLHAEASAALDRLVREIRRIDPDPDAPAGEPAADVDRLTATSIEWAGDSVARLDGTELILSIAGEGDGVLATDVSALEIIAYDDSNAQLGTSISGDGTRQIRRVEIRLTLERAGASETIEAKVYLRGAMAGTTAAGAGP